MNDFAPDMDKPLANGLSPREIQRGSMDGLEQFCASYESRIDLHAFCIDDEIKIESQCGGSHVRAAFMKYATDSRAPHYDVEIEVRIGEVFLSGLLSPSNGDPDYVLDAVSDIFDKCCGLIGKKPNIPGLVYDLPFDPGSTLISSN